MFEISGKVALVTGGASGIGLSTAETLLQSGSKGVSIIDVSEGNGNEAEQKLNKTYGQGKVLFIKTNVANRNEVEDAFRKTVDFFGNLDIVINGAAIVKDMKWEEEIAVNLGGVVACTYFAFEKYLPKYMSGSEGVIINLSSISAFDTFPYAPVYGATKSAILNFTQSYGSPVHYRRHKIRVMAICPGYTESGIHGMTPDRLLDPSFYKLLKQKDTGITIQPAEHVANAITSIIKNGKNGSVWIVENNKPAFEVSFRQRSRM